MIHKPWRPKRLIWAAVAGVILALPLSLTAAAAAPESQGPHGRRGFRGEGMGPGGPGFLLRELDLSEDQRQQIRGLFEELEASGAHERLMTARQSLHEAIENGSDEATIRQLAYEIGQAEGDAAVERARIHSRVQEILTVEQRQELETLKQEAKARMEERKKRFEERRERRRNQGSNPR